MGGGRGVEGAVLRQPDFLWRGALWGGALGHLGASLDPPSSDSKLTAAWEAGPGRCPLLRQSKRGARGEAGVGQTWTPWIQWCYTSSWEDAGGLGSLQQEARWSGQPPRNS